MTVKTVWRAVAEALAAEGVEYVFGLPGNPKHLIYDLSEHTKIKFVLVRDEQYAVACAYAHARLTRKPAVVFSNPGPGITKLVTGLLEATSGSLPVIAITNGVVMAHDGMGAFQELDSVAMMRAVTKWATRLIDPRKVHWTMQRAFSLAINGRPGGIYIDVPSDLAGMKFELPDYRPSPGRHRMRPDAPKARAAAALLAGAERPLLLCGSGAVFSGAAPQVRVLAERVGMPVFTTPGGRGIYPEDDALALGQVGLYFTAAGKSYYDAADLIVSVGSRLEAFSTNSWEFYPAGAKLVQIDIDPHAIAMNWRPDVAVVGDAALALDDIADVLPPINASRRTARLAGITAAKDAYLRQTAAEAAQRCKPIRVPQVLAAINAIFGRDTILVNENGGADLWCYYWPYYRVLDIDDCVPMAEQTAMGFGIAGTIGTKLARPGKNVVCVTGDGAMNMALTELATAAEWKCGVTWVVLNNRALGWVQYDQLLNHKPFIATNFEVAADFVKIAEAQGCRGVRVEDPGDVEAALAAALAANREGVPFLVDIAIRKHDYPPHFVDVHKARLEH
ncbi:MAG: thiamine pyrophosphate-binding protein [Steroidobacteraceae bacterium]